MFRGQDGVWTWVSLLEVPIDAYSKGASWGFEGEASAA